MELGAKDVVESRQRLVTRDIFEKGRVQLQHICGDGEEEGPTNKERHL